MKRSNDILLPRALLSIQHMSLRPVLAMVYCEGSIEYRDTTTMNVIPRDGKDQISSLAQVGLYFPGNRFCKSHVQPIPTSNASCSNHERHLSCIIGLHTTLSPNACAAVSLDEQHLASLCSLQFEDENTSDQLDESVYSRSHVWHLLTYIVRLEVIVEAFVMQSSVASLNNLNNEDIVAALQAFSNQYLHVQVQTGDPPSPFNSDIFKSHFLSELYRTIGVRVDYSMEPQLQQLLQSNQGLTLQRCLSVQAALGYSGGTHRPSLSAILAWTILNIRSIVMVSMGIISRKQGVENELSKPGRTKTVGKGTES